MASSNTRAVLILLTASLAVAPDSASPQPRTTVSCSQATTTKAGVGVAYNGEVYIDDYKLRARIPDGLTGWGGVAADAPFHGFTIFLNSTMRSCIVFEVHLRIDDDDAPRQAHAAKFLSLGNARAWQLSSGNSNRARGLMNVIAHFSFQQKGQVDDGKIMLIAPPEKLQKTKGIYDAFLNSVVFGAPPSR